MRAKKFQFASATVSCYFNRQLADLKQLAEPRHTVLITDEHIYAAHQRKFRGWNTIVLRAGEEYKVQATVDAVVEALIGMEADRKTTLVGVGGGVVTDITGYTASVYMRGIPFGFVPTSLLALVDASIGGKNGIDVGLYKNMVGVIRQPSFLLHDLSLLHSLPEAEWQNGFAEIIKHAAIRDAAMFRQLEGMTLRQYRKGGLPLANLVQRNALLKTRVVQSDEFEKGDRRLLNFGHTLGHALENQYALSHGQAISIGMVYAGYFSERITGFKETSRLARLLEKYGLPTDASFDRKKASALLKMDKKRERSDIHYILLEKIGKAVIQPIPVTEFEAMLLSV